MVVALIVLQHYRCLTVLQFKGSVRLSPHAHLYATLLPPPTSRHPPSLSNVTLPCPVPRVATHARRWCGFPQALRLGCFFAHPQLLRPLSSFVNTKSNELWVVKPVYLGTIRNIFVAPREHVLDEAAISYIIKSIVVGVDYLHRQGFVHRSISSSSVFVAGDSTMQLGHFKHAISTADESTGRRKAALYSRHEEEAQIPWQAPEYFRQDTVGYTEKIDIYSIGVVALELAYGAHPFEGMLPTATMLLKLQDETGALGLIAPGCKRRPSKALWQLLTQCLREDDFNRRVGINKPQHHSTTAPQH